MVVLQHIHWQLFLFRYRIFSLVGDGVHVSDEADVWFSKFFQKPGYRLYAKHPSGKLRTLKEDNLFGPDAKAYDKV